MVEPLDEFERELREQLLARSAPQGFTDRLMARVPRQQSPRTRWTEFGLPMWRWAVAALLVAAMVMGGFERDRQQRLAGQRAKQQVLLALRITGSTLREVQQKVNTGSEQQKLSQKGAGKTILEKDDQ
ncbi:MAG TPA: hypothetical protein VGF88_21475 [Acidobacteriaceae bacterium]